MNKVTGLLIPVLTIFGMATASYAAAAPLCEASEDAKIESLRTVYYLGGTQPPAPSEAELAALQELEADAGHPERARFLKKAFPGNEKLQAFAVRDQDGDGITDFRISECGLFRENDPDVDCDGISNVLDGQPYDEVAAPGQSCAREPDWRKFNNDENNNDLPDQIDWSMNATTAEQKRAARVQEELYRDYKIVLVNRQKLTDRQAVELNRMAIELDQIIREIFRGQIPRNFDPLRVIAADKSACGDDDYASASPESFTVSVVPTTITLKPILRLEVLVHEISHTIQYKMDFSEADLDGFRKQNRWDSNDFHEFAELLGWAAPDAPESDHPDLWPVVDHCNHIYPFEPEYQGKKPTQLQAAWDASDEMQRREQHMASRYAFTDAFEWEAEYKAAFVLNSLVDAAKTFCSDEEIAVLRRKMHEDMEAEEFEYDNENARGLVAYETGIASQFHVDEDTWIELTRIFLLGSYPGVCTE